MYLEFELPIFILYTLTKLTINLPISTSHILLKLITLLILVPFIYTSIPRKQYLQRTIEIVLYTWHKNLGTDDNSSHIGDMSVEWLGGGSWGVNGVGASAQAAGVGAGAQARSDRGQERARRARQTPHAAAPRLHHILVSLHTCTRHTLSIILLNFPTLRSRFHLITKSGI